MAGEGRDRKPVETLTNTGGLETADTLADDWSGPLPPPGSAVDRYVVGEELGAGGMGVVYRAYDPELDRSIALKFLHRALGSERYRARLRREARAMAQLRHPNVVSVYDIGEHEGVTWLAMEHVEGTTLREHMRGRGTWHRVLPLFAVAGRGLSVLGSCRMKSRPKTDGWHDSPLSHGSKSAVERRWPACTSPTA